MNRTSTVQMAHRLQQAAMRADVDPVDMTARVDPADPVEIVGPADGGDAVDGVPVVPVVPVAHLRAAAEIANERNAE